MQPATAPEPARRVCPWIRFGLMGLCGIATAAGGAEAATVAAGAAHTAVVRTTDGSVWMWGANDRGQLGNGTVVPVLTPRQVQGLAGVIAVASGDGHLLALTSTGEVWAWGANDAGQVGDATNQDRLNPLPILSGVIGIDAGPDFSVAWKGDGSLWTWGGNDSGQLGDGTVWPSHTPAPIAGIAGVAQASAGRGHVLALGTDGSIWGWGRNVFAQIGEGTREDHLSPVAVTAALDATVVVGGAEASYALRSDGSLWAWGANAVSQLGDGTTRMRLAAVAVRGPAAVQAVSAGGGHALARQADGAAWAWGRNDAGQAGNGTQGDSLPPTMLPLETVAAVAAGLEHSLAVTAEGVVWTWGRNTSGQLGDGTTDGRLDPVAISGPGFSWKVGRPVLHPPPDVYGAAQAVTIMTATTGATLQYTEDGSEPDATSAALPSGGTVSIPETTTLKVRAVKYGRSPSDTIAGEYTLHEPVVRNATVGAASGDEPTETAVAALGEGAAVTMAMTLASSPAVAGGERYSLTLLEDGSAWAWGNGGRLGDGTTTDRHYPVPVLGMTDVAALAAGTAHGLALKTDGTVWGWAGNNSNGQVGDGTTTQRLSPVPVSALSDIVAISAGHYFSLALQDDGTLWAWGDNYYGQLGLGDYVDRPSPQPVLTGVDAVVAGGWHVLALKGDGSVWTWGLNGSGQLGDVVFSWYRPTPAAVAGLSGIVEVVAGGFHSFARDGGGAVYGWGENGHGRLGDGTTTDRRTPVPIPGLSGVVDLEAGDHHSLAVLSDGTLLAWGYNGYGQLGDGTSQSRSTPVPVPGLADIVSVAGGDRHSLALAAEGSLWAWGENSKGQVGDGTTVRRYSPVKILEGGGGQPVATPILAPPGGSYAAEQAVTVTVAGPHDSIHYTRNGADPTEADPQVLSGGDIAVTESQTLKVQAFAEGMEPSNIATEVYSMTVATPTLSPGGGTYSTPQQVAIVSSVPGVEIRYTRDGSDPTTGSDLYTAPILVDATQTVKARSWRTGWTESAVATAQYVMAVSGPTLTPGGGSYGTAQQVVVSSVTPDITLRFTTNGVEPTEATGQVIVSGSSLLVDQSLTLRVRGWRAGWTPSPTSTANYFIPQGSVEAPAFSPPPGSYGTVQTVSITASTPDAVIRYTLDGSPPNATSPVYAAALSVDSITTVSAQAFKPGWSPSSVTSGTYTIAGSAVARPAISPPGGSFAAGRVVTIAAATPGAAIYYTTDGTDPTEGDEPIASGASLTLARSTRVKARAFKAGLEPSPVATADFDLVGTIVAGATHTLLLSGDGTLWAWGGNVNGELGDGTTVQRPTPVVVSALPPEVEVVAISAGQNHNLALAADGTVWGWGDNSMGQLGNGETSEVQAIPVQVLEAGSGLPFGDVIAISSGARHSLALRADGTVWGWGMKAHGQLGDGTFTPTYRSTPLQVPGLSGVTAISAGGYHSLALKTDGGAAGGLWAWGLNGNGQLGDGTLENRSSPLQVMEDVRIVCGAAVHTLAVKANGTIWGAGRNDHGQLGDDSIEERWTFSPALMGLSGVVKLAASGVHSLALTSDGLVWGTGYNDQGPLGDGTSITKTTPVRTVWLEDVVDLAAGQFVPSIYVATYTHSAALTADGRVWTWGTDQYGQLGTAIDGSSFRPRPLPDLQGSDQTWPLGDADQDGLTNAEELALGSDPYDADTNDDGLLDSAAVRSGRSATDPDMDADGLTNAAERLQGTDPFRADSDSDGEGDAVDCFPLDPGRSTCPTPTPGDVTPPSMTLTGPTNAVLVSTDPP